MNEAESRAIAVMFTTCSSAVLTPPKFTTQCKSLNPLYQGMSPHEDWGSAAAGIGRWRSWREQEKPGVRQHAAVLVRVTGLTVFLPAEYWFVGLNRRSCPWSPCRRSEGAPRALYRKAPPRTSGTRRGRVVALLPWKGNSKIDAMKTAATLVCASVLIC